MLSIQNNYPHSNYVNHTCKFLTETYYENDTLNYLIAVREHPASEFLVVIEIYALGELIPIKVIYIDYLDPSPQYLQDVSRKILEEFSELSIQKRNEA